MTSRPDGDPSERRTTDATLVRRMASGDCRALGFFYDQWKDLVYSSVVRVFTTSEVAEGLVEEIFWRAWLAAPTYDEASESVWRWLVSIMRRASIQRLSAKGIVRHAIAEAELCGRLQHAVAMAASSSAESMAGLHAVVHEFTVTLRDAGTSPEEVLILLKAVIDVQGPPRRSSFSSDRANPLLREQVSTWCIQEYFGERSA